MPSACHSIEELNPRQKQVVEQLDKNILLIASAGTGKTNVIAWRIANIIQQGKAEPREILCLTFTNRACREMKDRIFSIVGKPAPGITVKTFHGFCYSIIRECKDKTDLPEDFLIFDEEDCREIIAKISPGFYSTALQNVIDYIKEHSIPLGHSDYSSIISHICSDRGKNMKLTEMCCDSQFRHDKNLYNFILARGSRLVESYNDILSENHAVDFTDLLVIAGRLLQDEQVLKRLRARYRYIHIDEVQDTSENEYGIIQKLFHDSRVVLCGDHFQAIYEWRGSNPGAVMEDFVKKYNPEIVVFNQNYRSTKTLLDASHRYLLNTFGQEVRRFYKEDIEASVKDEGNKIILKNARDIADEALWIFRQIKALNSRGVSDISRIAVLTRTNSVNRQLSEQFDRINERLPEGERLRFMLVEEFKFFRRKEIKDILAFLKIVVNKYDLFSLERILLNFVEGVGPATIENIKGEEMRRLGIRLNDFLDPNTFVYGDPYYLLLQELDSGNVVVFDVESTGVNTAEDEIVQIAALKIDGSRRVIDRINRYLKPSKSVGDSELIHGYSDEFLSEHGEDPASVIGEFCEFIRDCVLVGHNVNYDINILASQAERLGLARPEFRDSFDTLDMARRFYPELPDHRLETLGRRLGAGVASDHRAQNDVAATKDVLVRMVNEKLRPVLGARMNAYNRYRDRFAGICRDIDELRRAGDKLRPGEFVELVIEKSGIREVYSGDKKRLGHIENFREIAEALDQPELGCRDALMELLKITSLSNSELDRIVEKNPQIPIITVHQAKGAEFDYVFLAGLQEFVFPSYPAIKSGDIDEEKRAFYVAITRAKKQLFLSWSMFRDGRPRSRSRFVDMLPKGYIREV